MNHGRLLTEQQLDEMAELRELGRTAGSIQRHFERQGVTVSRGLIEWQCLRLGADLPPERRRPSAQLNRPYERNGRLVRPFTPAEDRQLLALEAEGRPLNAIARQIGRGNNSVRGRLMILARREARAEEADGRGEPAVAMCGKCERAACDQVIGCCSDSCCPFARRLAA
ncbi:MAG: hypothetical protein QOH47_843 [Sphingomonadales bacterium]|jgi:hypothetical protein|nr:hypothetical protein [Sphingomonadales bacterium]